MTLPVQCADSLLRRSHYLLPKWDRQCASLNLTSLLVIWFAWEACNKSDFHLRNMLVFYSLQCVAGIVEVLKLWHVVLSAFHYNLLWIRMLDIDNGMPQISNSGKVVYKHLLAGKELKASSIFKKFVWFFLSIN